jgi:hypothetical protein
VLELTGQSGDLVARSIREARALAAKARGRGARAKLAAARRLEQQADLAEKVCRQITQRLAGEKITDRLVSLADPDARFCPMFCVWSGVTDTALWAGKGHRDHATEDRSRW